MKNICRPIVLYNVHVPANRFDYKWMYTAFGIYDGIDVRENIWGENTKTFSVLMDTLIRETLLLDGNFSKEVTFAIRQEIGNEEEVFWEERSYPFVFFVSLYMDGRAQNWTNLYRHIERHINDSMYGGDVKAICYQTLDNSDILLVIKAKSYKIGTDIINLFHNRDNKFIYEYQNGKYESIVLHYSYSICGFNRDVALDEEYMKEKIEEVSFFAFEKKPGSISPLMERLKAELKKSEAEILKVELLGSNDERIILKNITWGEFMNLYRKDSPVLTNESLEYCNSICYGSTQLNHKWEKTLAVDLFHKSCESDAAKGLITNERLSIPAEEIRKLKESVDDKSDSNNARELEYIKAISHIENAMQKFKDSEFPSYVYISILQPMQLFIKQLVAFKKGDIKNIELCTDNGIFDFLNAVSLVIQSTSRMNRDFLQTPDFNVVINDVPIKLVAFYAAWAYKVTQILNVNNAEPSSIDKRKKDYSVLICPGLEKVVEIEMIFSKFPPGDRLLLVKTPERALYKPEFLCTVLVHEISHYVGDRIRKRESRYLRVLEIYGQIIIKQFEENFNELWEKNGLDQNVKDKIHSLVKTRAEYYIRENKEKMPQYEQYQYYTDFLKKVSDNIIITLIDEDLVPLYEDIRTAWVEKLNSTEGEKTAYNEKFIDNLICGYEKSCAIKGEVENFKEYFRLNHRRMVDNINNMAKEIYADLICVLLLKIPGDVYLKNIYNSLNELSEDKDRKIDIKDNIISIRVALLVLCMQVKTVEAENIVFDYFWEGDVLQKTVKGNQNDNDFREWIKSINKLILFVESGNKASGVNKYLLDKEVWVYFIKYLIGCRAEFENWEKSDNSIKQGVGELRAMYSSVSEIDDIEDTVIRIRKFVEAHKIELKKHFK